jgi:hypothetical protein
VSVDGKLLAPREALWQVGAPQREFASVAESQSLTQQEYAIAARQSQITALIDSNALASQLHEWEATHWRQPWLDRLATGGPTLGEHDPPAWTRLRARFTTVEQDADLGKSVDVSACWDELSAPNTSYYSGDADGGLTLVRNTPPQEATRWFAALAIAGVVGAAWRYPSALQRLATSLRRWPYVCAIVIGSLWWLFLTPSLLGLAIIVLAMAASMKSKMQRGGLRPR